MPEQLVMAGGRQIWDQIAVDLAEQVAARQTANRPKNDPKRKQKGRFFIPPLLKIRLNSLKMRIWNTQTF